LGHHDTGDYYICLEKEPFVEIRVSDWHFRDIFRQVREARLKKQEGKSLFKQHLTLLKTERIPDGMVVA